jgi:magnesium transporter
MAGDNTGSTKVYIIDQAGESRDAGSLEGVELEQCKMVWMDAISPDDDNRRRIQDFFDIHPLAMEISRKTMDVPRVQEFDGHVLVIWNFLNDIPETDKVETVSLYMILGGNYLVTIHVEAIPEMDAIFKKLMTMKQIHHEQAAFFLYNIMNVAVEEYFPLVEDLEEKIDAYMDNLISDQNVGDLDTVMTLKHRNMAIRRTIYALRDVVMRLAGRDFIVVPEELSVYLMDVYERLSRLSVEVDNNSDLISSSLDIHLNAVSNRLNVTMKRLTAVATFFMPATFLAGIYGMNFAHMPETTWYFGYLFFWIFIIVITIVMVLVARKQDWL